MQERSKKDYSSGGEHLSVSGDGGGLKISVSRSYYQPLCSALCCPLFEIHSAYSLPFMVMLRISSWEQLPCGTCGQDECARVCVSDLHRAGKKNVNVDSGSADEAYWAAVNWQWIPLTSISQTSGVPSVLRLAAGLRSCRPTFFFFPDACRAHLHGTAEMRL